jgi:hypothetical protein
VLALHIRSASLGVIPKLMSLLSEVHSRRLATSNRRCDTSRADIRFVVNSYPHEVCTDRRRLSTQEQLDQVELLLNQRPRKSLGFETPASRLQKCCVDRLSQQG